jgi:alkyl hydroperoxide reductase subunit AhpF
MAFLSDRDSQAVQQELAKLAGPVRLIVFSQELGAETCAQTEQLLKEVAGLSDQISLEIYNLVLDREKAERYGADRVPAIVAEGARDYGVRFYGLPAGYEFSNLIDSILLAGSGRPQLSEATLARLAQVQKPIHIQVFTTPT